MKKYIDFMDEITADELYDGLLGYGMFAEKLPPVFSSVMFLDYCKNSGATFSKKKPKKYVCFESIRNTNIPRSFGIPTPMKYEVLCAELRDNWDGIRDVFRDNTMSNTYKISRIHIRKRVDDNSLIALGYEEDVDDIDDNSYDEIPETADSTEDNPSLFSMNYKNWRQDGTPLLDFSLGKKYIVKADISQCFPSVYSHAIPWALVGKPVAKCNRSASCWFNKIDAACRNIKDQETHGLLIGPHASNVLSEIILTSVDKELADKGYNYIRNIDDYTCYVDSYEKAERFLIELNAELRKYDFLLNHKKTCIEELPQAVAENWIQVLKDKEIIGKYGVVDYNTAQSYLNLATLVMKENGKNASSILFAIKVLGNNKISNSAKEFCIKHMCSLAIIYPYLVPNMDKYVFDAFNASVYSIEDFARVLYEDSVKKENFEGISYALFYAIKYNFILPIDEDWIIDARDCVAKTLLLMYARSKGMLVLLQKLYDEALRLRDADEFDENWVFVYETLNAVDISDPEWKTMKQNNVSFLKTI